MKHLTLSHILQTVDGTADYATQTVVTSHLAVCPRCRAEVEFQRSLMRTARRLPPPQISSKFTTGVMSRILPRSQNAVATWLLNNMGSVFAMMVVLGVLTAVMTNPTPIGGLTDDSTGQTWVQELKKGIEDGYSTVTSFIKRSAPVAEHTSNANGSGEAGNKIIFGVLSLVVLGLADRFLIHRFRTRPRN